MKKIIGLLLTLVFALQIQVFANGIEIQPTMSSRTNAQDRVWVGSFQLVWNDFINKVIFNPVRFREGNPTLVNELNKQDFTSENLSDSSYYKYAGKVGKKTKKQITRALKKKFKETSDMLDNIELTPRNDMFLVYAMLKKDFEFVREFSKLGHFAFGDSKMAEYFGIDENSDDALGYGVKVLFYNDSNDYAVMLYTMKNDEVYLYKNASNKPFNQLYADMLLKEKAFKGKKEFKKVDELKIPNLNFSEEKTYNELTNRRIMGTNLVINKALQSIKLDMNSKGVKIKSEAGMTAVTTSLLPPEELTPRLFYFDNTFVMFIKEEGKSNPYFALRVNDISKFQSK